MDWSGINKKWNVIYTDYNGGVWLSNKAPVVEEGFAQHYWKFEGKGGVCTQIPDDILINYTPNKENWKRSLKRRG